jgi:competence protein ComEC
MPDGRGPVLSWPAGLEALARTVFERVCIWALAEVAPGRLVPWLAITFGLGTVLYFAADQEPSPWAAAGALAAAAVAAAFARRHVILFPLCVGVAAVAAGFAAGTIKRALIAHPVLQVTASNVSIEGFVEIREERERSDRIVVRVNRIEGGRLNEEHPLERVRLAVSNGSARAAAGPAVSAAGPTAPRKSTAPAVGSFVKLKARLSPPLEPVRPGGYDFGRDMYFQHVA